MAPSVSYELYTFKNGDWVVNSVHNDKDQAIHEARDLLNSRHHMAIQVMEESYDEATDKTSSKLVYTKKKSDEPPKTAYKSPEEREKEKKAKPVAKKKKKKAAASSGGHTLIKITLSLGGLALGLISLLTFMILAFE